MEEMVLKMGKQLPKSVDNINKQVWDLFGVWDKYVWKDKATQATTVKSTTGKTFNRQELLNSLK
jgi:hypothetical protein